MESYYNQTTIKSCPMRINIWLGDTTTQAPHGPTPMNFTNKYESVNSIFWDIWELLIVNTPLKAKVRNLSGGDSSVKILKVWNIFGTSKREILHNLSHSNSKENGDLKKCNWSKLPFRN